MKNFHFIQICALFGALFIHNSAMANSIPPFTDSSWSKVIQDGTASFSITTGGTDLDINANTENPSDAVIAYAVPDQNQTEISFVYSLYASPNSYASIIVYDIVLNSDQTFNLTDISGRVPFSHIGYEAASNIIPLILPKIGPTQKRYVSFHVHNGGSGIAGKPATLLFVLSDVTSYVIPTITRSVGMEPISGQQATMLSYNLPQSDLFALQYSSDLINWTTITTSNATPWTPQVTANSANFYIDSATLASSQVGTNQVAIPIWFFRLAVAWPLTSSPQSSSGSGLIEMPQGPIQNVGSGGSENSNSGIPTIPTP